LRTLSRLSLPAIPIILVACGSVYDTNQAAPSAWVSTYSAPSGEASPASDGVVGTGDSPPADVEARLREAKKLRDDGLISEKEYQQLRKRVLGSL
jgi:hypothetical protein